MSLLGTETLSKFLLEHENRCSKYGAVLQQLEDHSGRNYVGNIGDAKIKVG